MGNSWMGLVLGNKSVWWRIYKVLGSNFYKHRFVEGSGLSFFSVSLHMHCCANRHTGMRGGALCKVFMVDQWWDWTMQNQVQIPENKPVSRVLSDATEQSHSKFRSRDARGLFRKRFGVTKRWVQVMWDVWGKNQSMSEMINGSSIGIKRTCNRDVREQQALIQNRHWQGQVQGDEESSWN